MESASSACEAAGRAPGARQKPSPTAAEVEAHAQAAFHVCELANALPDLASERRTLGEVKDENQEISNLLRQLRSVQQTTSDLFVKVKGQRNEGGRAGYKRNYCPSEETLVSIQKLIQANERDQTQLEKTLQRISDPQYVSQLATRLQKLNAAITRQRRENRQKESENKRIGKVLEIKEKGAESLVTRLLRELDHLSQEISIQKDKNAQLKEAVQRSEGQLEKMKDRYELLKEKHEEVARLLESQNMDIDTCQLIPRQDSTEMHEQEDQIASLHRKIEALTQKRASMHREHTRQATSLRRHVTILTKKVDSLTQQQTVLKMEANRLRHQIHEQVTGLPEVHKTSTPPPSASYAHVQPRVYASTSRSANRVSSSRGKSTPAKNNERVHPHNQGRSASGTTDSKSFAASSRRRRSSSQNTTKAQLKRRSKTGSITSRNLPWSTCGVMLNDADEDALAEPPKRYLNDLEALSILPGEADDTSTAVLRVSPEAVKSAKEDHDGIQNFPAREVELNNNRIGGDSSPRGNELGSSPDLHRLAQETLEQVEHRVICSANEDTKGQQTGVPETDDSGCVRESEPVVPPGFSLPSSRTRSFGGPPWGRKPEFSGSFEQPEPHLSPQSARDM